jgi:multiple sugar transport system permease protein
VLFHIAFQTGFCTLFMRNFIKALPFELIERADRGRRRIQDLLVLVLPLMRPAIAALAVLVFTFIWNDYFWATVLTQGDDRSRSPPVSRAQRTIRRQWQLVSAGLALAALPPVLMFFLMQRHFIAGLTLGATKGYR